MDAMGTVMSKYSSREELFESYQDMSDSDWTKWVLSLTTTMADVKVPLYHISFNNNLPRHIKPQYPAGGGTHAPHSIYHEPLPERISASPTIQGCWAGIYANYSEQFERDAVKEPLITFSVYRVVPDKNVRLLLPHVATDEWLMYDAHITLEHSIFGGCSLDNIGTMTIENLARAPDEDWIIFNPFNDVKYKPMFSCFRIPAIVESDVKYSPLLYSKPVSLTMTTEARKLEPWLCWGR